MRVELIDVWHFILSFLLQRYSIEDGVALSIEVLKEQLPGDTVIIPQGKWGEEENSMLDRYLAPYEALIELSLKPCDDYDYAKNLMRTYILCLTVASMTFDELHSLYIGKNALNILRQNYGYQEGVYKKMWNGVEDNVVMQGILDGKYGECKNCFEDVYNKLDEIYQEILKSA